MEGRERLLSMEVVRGEKRREERVGKRERERERGRERESARNGWTEKR